MDKSKDHGTVKRPKIEKGMTQKQIRDISCRLNEHMSQNATEIMCNMESVLSRDATLSTDGRQAIMKALLHGSLINNCTIKFCELYESCHGGLFKDRYGLLQICCSLSSVVTSSAIRVQMAYYQTHAWHLNAGLEEQGLACRLYGKSYQIRSLI